MDVPICLFILLLMDILSHVQFGAIANTSAVKSPVYVFLVHKHAHFCWV